MKKFMYGFMIVAALYMFAQVMMSVGYRRCATENVVTLDEYNPEVDYQSMSWFFGYVKGLAPDSIIWEQCNELIESTINNPEWVGGDDDMESLHYRLDSIMGIEDWDE